MNENNKPRQIIIMSLAALLIGSLLFIFGASFKDNLFPMIANYVFAMLLYVSAFLAVYRNHQKDSLAIYKYIMVLTVGLMLLVTITVGSYLI